MNKELFRLHHGAWLRASSELLQAVQQRVQADDHLRRQAIILEGARMLASRRQQSAEENMRKAALDEFARNQADVVGEMVRHRTVQILSSALAAKVAAGKLEQEKEALDRQRFRAACARTSDAFAHHTFAAVGAVST
eukprot:Tamp_28085.p1 GENE.Tamp_28085~~Tamp_28085.p1  ORF type:complete len:137 (-),score=30.59 Tamp_28085:226-636(-)